MTPSMATVPEEAPLAWAATHVRFARAEIVRQSPWGTTLRLDGEQGSGFLKVVAPRRAASVAASAAVAAVLDDMVAAAIACDPVRGYLLSADHGGLPPAAPGGPEFATSLLAAYAGAQARTALALPALAPVPRFALDDLWLRTHRFLDCRALAPRADDAARLADFVGLERATLVADAVATMSAPLLRRMRAAAALPVTLEHGDLHAGNVAVVPGGGLRLHDWEEARLGPAGLSFSCLVPGTADLVGGLDGDGSAACVAADYAGSLAAAGYAPLELLRGALPAAVLAGLFVRLCAYADYPPRDEATRELCVPDLEHICAEILGWCRGLALDDPAGAGSLMRLFHEHGRPQDMLATARALDENALAVVAGGGTAAGVVPVAVQESARLVWSERAARSETTVPCLGGLRTAHLEPGLMAMRVDAACAMLVEHGCLVLEQLCPAAMLDACLAYQRGRDARDAAAAARVGDRRTMQPAPLSGPFNDPFLYAHPLVMHVMAALLGPDFVIGSMSVVTSQPGADAQHLHADHPPLFPDQRGVASLPAYAFTVLVPLVDLDAEIGGTELHKGSHLGDGRMHAGGLTRAMRLGDVMVFDYRLAHRGLANRSTRVRPVLSIVYQRSWFRDAVNFGGFAPLQVPFDELARIPEALSGLFRLAEVTAAVATRP
jgi:hypothetical protein